MTLTVGRITFTDSPNEGYNRDGDRLQFSVDVLAKLDSDAGLTDAQRVIKSRIIRQQALGLQVGDVVPVTWSDDPSWEGYYVVTAPCVVGADTMQLTNGAQVVSFNLRRVAAGYGSPDHAVRTLVSARSPQSGSAPGDATVAVPAASIVYSSTFANIIPSTTDVRTEGGNVDYASHPDADNETAGTTSFEVPPSNYYDGAAAAILNLGDADSEYVIVGRQLEQHNVDDVTLSNGKVQFRARSDGAFEMRRYADTGPTEWTSWRQPIRFVRLRDDETAEVLSAVGQVRVHRNEPDAVTLRWLLQSADVGYETQRAEVFARLRRGAQHVDLDLRHVQLTDGGVITNARSLGVQLPTTIESNTISGTNYGSREASDDADGNRLYVMNADDPIWNDNLGPTDATFATSAVKQVVAGLGLNTSSRVTLSTFEPEIVYQWFTGVSDRQRVAT